jgi:hypothetical protein
MEEVCERENLLEALRRVKGNKGSAGIDGMTVGQLSGYLKEHNGGGTQRFPITATVFDRNDPRIARWCGRGQRATVAPMPI